MKEHWGINYDSASSPTLTYTYAYNDATKQLVLSTFSPMTIDFRIVNWKWFTKYISFSDSIATFSKLTGDENGNIKVDFSKIEGNDSSNFKVGGRVHLYFAISGSYWFNINSYGYFFELKDWTEPGPKLNVIFIVTMVLVSVGIIGFASLVIFCYCRRSYNYKKMMKAAEENS